MPRDPMRETKLLAQLATLRDERDTLRRVVKVLTTDGEIDDDSFEPCQWFGAEMFGDDWSLLRQLIESEEGQ